MRQSIEMKLKEVENQLQQERNMREEMYLGPKMWLLDYIWDLDWGQTACRAKTGVCDKDYGKITSLGQSHKNENRSNHIPQSLMSDSNGCSNSRQ
ncbi:hypothetical protein JHK85_001680 [Glycine max]|nr:hypothetical protein JHK85_001680 [Glycine max]